MADKPRKRDAIAVVPPRSPNEQAAEYLTILVKGVLGIMPVGTLLNELFFESRSREAMRRFQAHVSETALLVQANLLELRDAVEDLDDKVAARAADEEARGVMWNYTEQATREPILERQLMLEHAHAAIVDVRVTVAEHARVQRRLGEVEPDDVLALWAIDRCYGTTFRATSHRSEAELRYAYWRSLASGEALLAAGCVVLQADGGGVGVGTTNVLHVTGFGRLMLRVLRTYCRPRGRGLDIPGREQIAGSRSGLEAQSRIDAHKGLRELVARHVASDPGDFGRARYMAPFWSQEQNGPTIQAPKPNGAARLDLYRLDAATATALSATAPFNPVTDEIMHGLPSRDNRDSDDGDERHGILDRDDSWPARRTSRPCR